jgi:hypothetical protein
LVIPIFIIADIRWRRALRIFALCLGSRQALDFQEFKVYFTKIFCKYYSSLAGDGMDFPTK